MKYILQLCIKNINNKIILPQMTGYIHILIHTHNPERM